MAGPDVVARLLAVAAAGPDLPAVVTRSATVTYRDLVAAAWGLAGELARFGPHPRVAILLPQGAAAYGAMFGTLMAGGYYLAGNTSSVPAKLTAILERFEPDVAIIPATGLAGGSVPDGLSVLSDIAPDYTSPVPCPAHRLAYVLFTSGSTGVPKGVMISRRALDHYVDRALAAMAPGPGDRWSQHPNIGFDLSVLDIYGALCSGAALYPLASEMDRMLPGRFIAGHRLTIWNSVPSVLDMMAKAGDLTSERLASLRLMTFCGEPLHAAQVRAMFQARPDLAVHNTYGPTEATVSCTLAVLNPADFADEVGGTVSLGEAIAGMTLHQIDGDEGIELAISGPQLADGYWRDEERSAQAFRTIETANGPVRAYVTGDLVRSKNGRLYFERRRDTQVKVRGHRLELDEVNAALRALGFAGAATVLVGGQLHAFVIAPAPLDGAGIRAELGRRLDAHAVPAFVHPVADLPRNANDKIDLAGLERLAATLGQP